MVSIHQFEVTGRMKPTDKVASPPVFRMKIFAKNAVLARSRFWYFVSYLKRVKRSNGEILSVSEIFEKKPSAVKNYGFFVRYTARAGTHNMYKEFRDITVNSAVEKLYADLAAQHRARSSSIQIISYAVLDNKDCKRSSTMQYHDADLKFKMFHRNAKAPSKSFKKVFKATRPNTFY